MKHEIKSTLAKLLATEDLIVEHKNVETAQFNVHNRVLTLPNWDKASEGIFDMLVCHEVGHALYTPDRDWTEGRVLSQSFINIVEDARIEKLMKRRYEGVSKTFFNAYNELSDIDFFEINNKEVDEMNLADRINLHYKIGNFVDIDFIPEEQYFIDKIDVIETFDEALDVAEELYAYCKQKKAEEKQKLEEMQQMKSDLGMDMEDMVGSAPSQSSDDNGEGQESDDVDGKPQSVNEPVIEDFEDFLKDDQGKQEWNEEPESETMEALNDALKNLTNTQTRESQYIEIPELNLKNIIVSNEKVHKDIDAGWIQNEEGREKYVERYKDMYTSVDLSIPICEEIDKMYYKFKRDAHKEVNYLVKEFERRKCAGAYARSSTSRTGVLDTKSLHTYKFNEDIFKKITVVPDGKNHGLVFILDWSGSMNNVILDTLKQLYNLIWFCRKVQIPYEVYAFTIDYSNYDPMTGKKERVFKVKDNEVQIPDSFHLLNFFTYKTKTKDLDRQMLNIFRLAASFDWKIDTPWIQAPHGYRLSGTPLNETMIALRQLLPEFKKNTNVEKVQCVVLTDGEGQPMRYNKEVKRDWEDELWMGTQYFGEGCFIRDRELGTTYLCEGHYYDDRNQTDVLLKNLRERLPSVNFIGIRIMPSREGSSFAHRYLGYGNEDYEKIMKRWRKEKSFAIKDAGYHTYFGMASTSLANDADFEVQDDATKAQIKRAFFKSLKNKKMNKKILGEFIELVA